MKHVPNALSLARIVIAPAFLVLLLTGTFVGQLVALLLFIAGAVSDWADGAIARRYGVGSRLGQWLDPLADKILVLGAFFALMFLPPDDQGRVLPALWWWIPVLAIALRDVAVTLLRSWANRRGTPLHTRTAAKAKTGVQLTFLIALQVFIVAAHLDVEPGFLGAIGNVAVAIVHSAAPDVMLVITALLTVWTGAQYFRRPPATATPPATAP